MISVRLMRRGFAAILGLSLLSAGPVWAEEQMFLPGRTLNGDIGIIPTVKVDFRAAARAVVLAETGLALPSLGGAAPSNPAAAANPGTTAGSAAPAEKKAPDWSTVPPNAPRTTHSQKLAAFTALAVLTVVSVVLAVREVRRDDPALTPGTPTRIP
jgi:hypothetical protein